MGKSFRKYIEEERRQRYTNKDQNGRKQLQENLLRKMDESIKEGKKETEEDKSKRRKKEKRERRRKKWGRLEGKGGVRQE